MLDIKDWITFILAFLALIVSIMAWRESNRNAKAAEDSAEAAKMTYDLTKRLHDEQQAKEQSRWQTFREEHIKKLVKSAHDINNAFLRKYSVELLNNLDQIDYESIKRIPKEIIFSDEELIDYFDENEREQIKRSWNSLQYFFEQVRETDPIQKGISYTGSVLKEFSTLISIFERR
ncbi:hypothetical protein [Paenibacillus validus]|uniref:hypothetical protein n=1 Tax=Paenibacillus validus TaxID=44253 RepID=UPI003D26BEF1